MRFPERGLYVTTSCSPLSTLTRLVDPQRDTGGMEVTDGFIRIDLTRGR